MVFTVAPVAMAPAIERNTVWRKSQTMSEDREFLGEDLTNRQRAKDHDCLVGSQPSEAGRKMNHVSKSRPMRDKEQRQIGINAAR